MRQYLVGLLALAVLAAPAAVVANGRGHGHGHGHGGHGGPSVSAPAVSAPSGSAPAGGALEGFTVLSAPGKAREQSITDLQACTASPTPGAGLVFYDTKANGSFTYWGYEMATPDFVDCLKGRGYAMPEAGRAALTNFGAR